MLGKYPAGSYAFYDFYDFTRAMVWCRLDQVMHMIPISSYFQKPDPVISFFDARANLHERLIYWVCEYDPTVFCRTYEMVNQITYVMGCM